MTPEDKRACKPSPTPGRNMLSAFTYYADFSMPIPEDAGNIVIKDCVFDNVERFLHYNFSGNETWQRHKPLKNIAFENIEANNVEMALNAYGREDFPLELTLKNVKIRVKDGAAVDTLVQASHCKRIVFDNVKVENFGGDCLIRTLSDGEYVFEGVESSLDRVDFVKKSDKEFNIKKI